MKRMAEEYKMNQLCMWLMSEDVLLFPPVAHDKQLMMVQAGGVKITMLPILKGPIGREQTPRFSANTRIKCPKRIKNFMSQMSFEEAATFSSSPPLLGVASHQKNLAYIHFYFHTINSGGESLSDIRLIFPTPIEVSHLITFF